MLIDYAFHGAQSALELKCRIKDGWRKAEKTYCFSEKIKLEWRGFIVKPQVSVFPSPASLHVANKEFALRRNETGLWQEIKFAFGPETLTLDLPLTNANGTVNQDLPWDRTSSDKLCIKWERSVQGFRVNLLAVFDRPAGSPVPIERDWGSGFLSGGLPSLGKRR